MSSLAILATLGLLACPSLAERGGLGASLEVRRGGHVAVVKRHAAQEDDSLPPPEAFAVGDRVEAQYSNGMWYTATVREIRAGGSYLLDWDDEDTRERVKDSSEMRKKDAPNSTDQALPDTDPCYDTKALPGDLQGACNKSSWRARQKVAERGGPLEKALETDPNKNWPLLDKLARDAAPGQQDGLVRKAVAGGPLKTAMEKIPDKSWPLLVFLLEDQRNDVRKRAAGAPLAVAVEKLPNKTLPVLTKLAEDDDMYVKQYAEGSFAEAFNREPDKCFPLLVSLANDGASARELAAGPPLAVAVEKLPNETLPVLTKLAEDENVSVRVRAAGPPLVEAFKKMPEKSAPILATLLGDDEAAVRLVAAGDAFFEAVQRIPLKDAEAMMQQTAKDTDVEVVKNAGRANAWVAKELAALASEAQAETVKQMHITARALDDAKKAKADSDANLQWNHWLQRIMAILVVFFIGLVILAWNGQRMLTEYQERSRQERIKAKVDARTTGSATSHKFFFVDADMIRGWQGGPIPHYQRLMPLGWLYEKTWDLGEAIRGMYNQDYLIISHRWYSPQHPDPTGEKVKELQKFLKKNPSIKYVWMDFWSLPQSKEERRTEEEEVTFRLGLANIFMLFISAQVLVLFDMQYAGRFWTSYELWLSLRTITAQGLESTPAHLRRATLVCMGASNEADETNKNAMHETWADKSPEEAAAVLGAEDIVVTNKKDKDQQLNVLRELAANAAAIFMRCVG